MILFFAIAVGLVRAAGACCSLEQGTFAVDGGASIVCNAMGLCLVGNTSADSVVVTALAATPDCGANPVFAWTCTGNSTRNYVSGFGPFSLDLFSCWDHFALKTAVVISPSANACENSSLTADIGQLGVPRLKQIALSYGPDFSTTLTIGINPDITAYAVSVINATQQIHIQGVTNPCSDCTLACVAGCETTPAAPGTFVVDLNVSHSATIAVQTERPSFQSWNLLKFIPVIVQLAMASFNITTDAGVFSHPLVVAPIMTLTTAAPSGLVILTSSCQTCRIFVNNAADGTADGTTLLVPFSFPDAAPWTETVNITVYLFENPLVMANYTLLLVRVSLALTTLAVAPSAALSPAFTPTAMTYSVVSGLASFALVAAAADSPTRLGLQVSNATATGPSPSYNLTSTILLAPGVVASGTITAMVAGQPETVATTSFSMVFVPVMLSSLASTDPDRAVLTPVFSSNRLNYTATVTNSTQMAAVVASVATGLTLSCTNDTDSTSSSSRSIDGNVACAAAINATIVFSVSLADTDVVSFYRVAVNASGGATPAASRGHLRIAIVAGAAAAAGVVALMIAVFAVRKYRGRGGRAAYVPVPSSSRVEPPKNAARGTTGETASAARAGSDVSRGATGAKVGPVAGRYVDVVREISPYI